MEKNEPYRTVAPAVAAGDRACGKSRGALAPPIGDVTFAGHKPAVILILASSSGEGALSRV